jgi:betaine-aldehyde dehydrogenase
MDVSSAPEIEELRSRASDGLVQLVARVWTADPDRGVEVARRMLSGTVGVNSHNMDLAGPFRGYRQSGVGRECGPAGISDYTELKCTMPPIGAGLS